MAIKKRKPMIISPATADRLRKRLRSVSSRRFWVAARAGF
jgi:hypothetical protein